MLADIVLIVVVICGIGLFSLGIYLMNIYVERVKREGLAAMERYWRDCCDALRNDPPTEQMTSQVISFVEKETQFRKEAYHLALDRLAAEPSDMRWKVLSLELGRLYYAVGVLTARHEVAIKNDIEARL